MHFTWLEVALALACKLLWQSPHLARQPSRGVPRAISCPRLLRLKRSAPGRQASASLSYEAHTRPCGLGGLLPLSLSLRGALASRGDASSLIHHTNLVQGDPGPRSCRCLCLPPLPSKAAKSAAHENWPRVRANQRAWDAPAVCVSEHQHLTRCRSSSWAWARGTLRQAPVQDELLTRTPPRLLSDQTPWIAACGSLISGPSISPGRPYVRTAKFGVEGPKPGYGRSYAGRIGAAAVVCRV